MTNSHVAIAYDRCALTVCPAVEHILAPVLSCHKTVSSVVTGKTEKIVEPIYEISNNTLVTLPGFLKRVTSSLRNCGVTYDVTVCEPSQLPDPVFDNLEPLRLGQDAALEAIVLNRGGIIKATTGFGKSVIIRQITRMWPNSRILIVTYDMGIVYQLFEDIDKSWAESGRRNEVGILSGKVIGGDRRIICCVDRSLHKYQGNPDILIYDECHRAGAEETAKSLSTIRAWMRLGFSATPLDRGNGTGLVVEGLFGPIIVTFDDFDARAQNLVLPAYVIVSSCDRLQSIFCDKIVDCEKYGVWRNLGRNELVLRAVNDAINKCGEDAQILVPCQKVEHVLELQKILPSDFVATYRTVSSRLSKRFGVVSMSAEERNRVKSECRTGKIKRIIGTGLGVGVDIPNLAAVIVASAGGGVIQSFQESGRVIRVSENKYSGLVYDFDDCHCQTLHGRWWRRRKIYKSRGWEVIDWK